MKTMKTIYLATDVQCWTRKKISERKLGGGENFFLILRQWLMDEGYIVYDPVLTPYSFNQIFSGNNKPDLTIFSNSYNEYFKGEKNILWSGSWHVSSSAPVDKHICVSEYFQKEAEIENAIVIPPPYAKDIENYKNSQHTPNRIVSTSNPNRCLNHAADVCKHLDKMEVNYEYHFSGGNKLYSDKYPEAINFHLHPKLIHRGILTRHELLSLLTSAHVWAYPNFTDGSETFCSAVVEAAALGIQTIVPPREPFLSTVPGSLFAETPEMMAKLIRSIFKNGLERKKQDMSMYSEEAVRPQILEVIMEVLK